MTLASEYGLTLRELKKISKILILANASVIENELAKIANSDIRKKIWVLIDGKRLANEIANDVGVNPSTVSRFLEGASAAELVEYAKGEPPRKILDYVPPSWIDLVIGEESQKESKETGASEGQASENEQKPKQATLTELSTAFSEGAKRE